MLTLVIVLVGMLTGFTGARILRRPAATAATTAAGAGAASMARSMGGALGARRELDLPHLQRAALSEMLRHIRPDRPVPSEFRVRLHPDDKATVDQAPGFFRQGLEQALTKAGTDHGWEVPAPVHIELVADPTRPRGAPAVDGRGPVASAAAAPPKEVEPARLVAGDGTDHGLGAVTTIGRGPDRDVRIDDSRVSRNHAVVRREGDHWTVTDEGSSNGTRRNGTRLTATTPVRLADGDELGVGPVTFTFRSGVFRADP